MKVVVGQKLLNLEELFNLSVYSLKSGSKTEVEVVIDSQILAELNKKADKESPAFENYPKDDEAIVNLKRENVRAILVVKLI